MKKANICTIREKLKTPFVQAVLLNLAIMITLLVIFNPTQKSDDYYLSEILYGAVSGEYDVHLIYNHIFLGYILKGLLLLFPNVAWYTVSQAILVFVSFVLITYYILKNYHKEHSWKICFFFLLYFGFECYVRVTFTKTAAVLVAVGLFFVLKGIFAKKFNIVFLITGLVQIFLGMLYRQVVLNQVLAIMAGIFVIEALWILFEKRKINSRMIILVGIILLLQFSNTSLNKVNKYIYSLDENWSQYFYINDIKSKIIDYTQNEYEKYEDEYKKVGLSENDLSMIYNNEMYDQEVMTEEKLLDAIDIVQQEARGLSLSSILNPKNILSFLRVPMSYVRIVCFGVFIFLTFLMFAHPTWKELCGWVWVVLLMLAENYYLFLKGRVLQIHVDVGIIFSMCLVLIYFMEYKKKEQAYVNKKICFIFASMLILFNVTDKFNYLTAYSFLDYGSDAACNIELNEDIAEILAEDRDHLYITESRETVFSRWQIDAYEVIPKGYYSNIYSLSSYIWPTHRKGLETFDIENPYKEFVDSEKMLFLVSDYHEETCVERLTTYIQEHYSPEAELVKLKEVSTVNIYRCISKEIQLGQYPDGMKELQSQLEVTSVDGEVLIKGYSYIEDSNSYEQEVYLEVYNTETQEKEYYLTLKSENPFKTELMDGKYSQMRVSIPEDVYNSESNEISVITIADGELYKECVK